MKELRIAGKGAWECGGSVGVLECGSVGVRAGMRK